MLKLRIAVVVAVALLLPALSVAGTPHRLDAVGNIERMPSLFSAEEAQYDRYAACWAATEGLRRMRDKAQADEGSVSKEESKRAHTQFVVRSGEVLKALGMSVNQFNQLGKQISQDKELKEKVLEQAYLYRMASTLNMDRVPLIEDPASRNLLNKQKVDSFCESVSEIEMLRSKQIKKLKKSLQVDRLPKDIKISDPAVLPLLSPKVRAVVEAFPLQAEEIVKKHGLHSDEFNAMMKRKESNPMFRWKVEKCLKQRDQKEEPAKKNSGVF